MLQNISNEMLFFWTLIIKKPEKKMHHSFHKNMKQHNCFWHW